MRAWSKNRSCGHTTSLVFRRPMLNEKRSGTLQGIQTNVLFRRWTKSVQTFLLWRMWRKCQQVSWLSTTARCLKFTQNVPFEFLNFGTFHQFCLIKTDLSGNTIWPQASGFQKLAKMDHFWHFQLTFVHSKCKRSSLRSQCWMRLFLWFSNTVLTF